MPIGLGLGLGAALCWGLTDVCGALAGRRLGSLPVIAGAQLVSLLLLVGLALAVGGGLPSDGGIIATSALMGVAAAGAYVTFFTALRIGPIAVVSPTVAAYGGLTVVLAVIFRGESLSLVQAIGAATATAGVVIAGLVFEGGWRKTRLVGPGVLLATVSLVLFAFVTVGLAAPIQAAGWLPVILVSRIANTIAVWLLFTLVIVVRPVRFAPLLRTSQARGRGVFLIVAAAGALDLLGFISYANGLEIAETWLVGLTSSFGPAVTVLVAVAFLGERPRRTQWMGLAGIAAGLAAVGLG
jgi:drug/metabolite transporter (DMT)-like permease